MVASAGTSWLLVLTICHCLLPESYRYLVLSVALVLTAAACYSLQLYVVCCCLWL